MLFPMCNVPPNDTVTNDTSDHFHISGVLTQPISPDAPTGLARRGEVVALDPKFVFDKNKVCALGHAQSARPGECLLSVYARVVYFVETMAREVDLEPRLRTSQT